MTAAAQSNPTSGPIPRSRWPRLVAPIGVLLLEYLAISLAFDIRPLAERADWLSALGSLGAVGPLLIAVATATLLIGGSELRSEMRIALSVRAASHAAEARGRPLALLALHGFSFAAFFALTHLLVQPGAEAPSRLFVLAWAGSGLIVLLTVAHAILPVAALVPLVRRTWHALVVGALVGVSAWVAGVWAERLWPPLADATLLLTSGLLRAVGAEVSTDPTTATIAVNGFEAVISSACSGYQGIGLFLVLTAAYLWAFRRELRFPIVLLLVPLGVVLVWLANALRIAALMGIGAWASPEVALGGFHSKAGWVLLCAIALGLVALTRRSPLFHRHAREDRDLGAVTWNPTASYLMPLLAVVATSMVINLFSSGFNFFYAAGPLAGALAVWVYRRDRVQLVPLDWSWSACGIGIGTFALWIALEPTPDVVALAAFERDLGALDEPTAALWLLGRLVGSVVVVPVVEELAFRGYLLRRLVSADFTSVSFARFTWPSLLVSSLAFGFLHQSWLAGCLAGMLFALAQYRRGRLGDAILAHAVANLLIAGYAIGWGHWSLWV